MLPISRETIQAVEIDYRSSGTNLKASEEEDTENPERRLKSLVNYGHTDFSTFLFRG
jgi:hypothetical protein